MICRLFALGGGSAAMRMAKIHTFAHMISGTQVKKVWGLAVGLLMVLAAQAQHSLQRFAAPINTAEYDEICPIMSYEEDYMFFTRVGSPDFDQTLYYDSTDLAKTLSADQYDRRLREILTMISGQPTPVAHKSDFNQDVWYALSDRGRLSNVHHPGYPINSALPNSICSTFGREGEFVIVNQFFADGSLSPGFSRVHFDGTGQFSFPKPLEIVAYNNEGNEVSVSMSEDGQVLFLSMKDRSSLGGQDIYISRKVGEKLYSQPLNLTAVNTRYRESTPFISKDKTKLYFASNRPGGLGGMDIYVSERLDLSYMNWSEPTHLLGPLNGPSDDSHPYVSLDENTILFTSDRDGSLDIFRAKLKRDSIISPVTLKIRILDNTGTPVAGEINWTEAYGYEPPFSGFFRPRDGHFAYTIEQNVPHTIYATKRKLTSQKAIVDPQEFYDAGITEYYLDLYLGLDGKIIPASIDRDVVVLDDDNPQPRKPKAEPEKAVVAEPKREPVQAKPLMDGEIDLSKDSKAQLRNIYFARGRSEVLPASYPTLERLARLLKENPNVVIQIEGHTDNVGNPDDLRLLSDRRARAIKGFLVRKGVLATAVKTKGYGASQPLNGNETEKDRRANRRVEIRVLKGGSGKTNR